LNMEHAMTRGAIQFDVYFIPFFTMLCITSERRQFML